MKSLKWLPLICSLVVLLGGCKEDNSDPVVFDAPSGTPTREEVPSSPSEDETVPEVVAAQSFNGAVQHIAMMSDGSLVAVGDFSLYGDNPAPGIAKLNPDRSMDSTFSSNLGNLAGQISGVKVLDGDSLAFFGRDLSANSGSAVPVLKMDSDGMLDQAFVSAMSAYRGQVNDMQQDKNGNLHLVGEFDSSSMPSVKNVMVMNLAGAVVNSYEKVAPEDVPRAIEQEVDRHLELAENNDPEEEVIPQVDPIPVDMQVVEGTDQQPNPREPASDNSDESGDVFADDQPEQDPVADAEPDSEEEVDQLLGDNNVVAENDTQAPSVSPEKVNRLLKSYQVRYKMFLIGKQSLQHMRLHKKRTKQRLQAALEDGDKKELKKRWKAYKKKYKERRKALKKRLAKAKNEYKDGLRLLKKLIKSDKEALAQNGVNWKDVKSDIKEFRKNLKARASQIQLARN